MIRMTIFASVAFLGFGQAAPAQTFKEAVQMNVGLATTLCLEVMIRRTPAVTAFGNAGFVYRSADRGVNNYGVALGPDHYFDAPADTVKAELDTPNDIAGICQVLTTHLSETELTEIVAETIFRVYPGARVQGPNQWFIDTPSGLPLIVGTDTIGTNHRYEVPGTVRVGMSYPG